jgi:flagellar biosynthesis/type III secretory pathway protein FliH
MTATGLAGLYSTMAPRAEEPLPPPDLDAIHDAGWRAGFAAGEAAAHDRLAPLRASLAAAATALDGATQIDRDALRPLFVTLVNRIAAAVLMAELTTGAVALLPLVELALAQVRVGEAATLCGHPDTLAALQAHLPVLTTAADAGMARDAFRITGPTFVIETGLAARLAEIVEQLA